LKNLAPPATLRSDATNVDKEVFKIKITEFVKLQNKLQANFESAYTLLLGHCNELTLTQLQGLSKWKATNDAPNLI